MNRRAFTLVELMIAAATAGVIATVSALLFKAAFAAYIYTVQQSAALSSARAAISGDGSRFGILWESQSADSVQSLTSSELTVVSSGTTTRFFLQNGNMYRARGGVSTLLAVDVDSMTVNYYNVNSATGLLIESTATASASFVTAQLTMQGAQAKDKTYRFFSGARLRNHP